MVTTATWGRRELFRSERWAKLLIDTLYHYRGKGYLLHEFAIMSDHLHVILTPMTSLEKAVQFIKGGFSYRAKKELGSNLEVWQAGFSDHRIRDVGDYRLHVIYLKQNPVQKGLCEVAGQYEYSSASGRYELDDVPQGLKPSRVSQAHGAAEAAPLQSKSSDLAEAAPFESKPTELGVDVPFQNRKPAIGAGGEFCGGVQVDVRKIAPKPEIVESAASAEKLAVNERRVMTSRQPTTSRQRPTTEDQRLILNAQTH